MYYYPFTSTEKKSSVTIPLDDYENLKKRIKDYELIEQSVFPVYYNYYGGFKFYNTHSEFKEELIKIAGYKKEELELCKKSIEFEKKIKSKWWFKLFKFLIL